MARHYILRRSVVFIVDNHFDSVVYSDLALDIVKNLFKELDDKDYFGYIPINSQFKDHHEIMLEKCGRNRQVKQKLLAK